MEAAAIIADAAAIASILREVVTTIEDALPFVEALYNLLVLKQPLTDEVRASLNAKEATLRAALQASSIPADKA